MCTGDPSSDASSMSHALSDISCAGGSFEMAAVCNRVLGLDILKMGKISKYEKWGYTLVHILLKKLMYERYEKWGYTHGNILLKLM